MNLSTAIALLAAGVGTTTVAVTSDELLSVYESAMSVAARVQQQNDAQLVKAARIAYAMNMGHAPLGRAPTEAELVAAGYLESEFLTRERVESVAEAAGGELAAATLR